MSEMLAQVGEATIGKVLARRPRRQPDDEAETNGLSDLAHALADEPDTVMQRVAGYLVRIGRADTAGISLLAQEPERCFRWHAVAGAWASRAGQVVRFAESPCSIAVERDKPVLFAQPQRRFTGWDIAPAGRKR